MAGPLTRPAFTPLITPGLHKLIIEIGKERPLEYPFILNSEPMPWNPIVWRQMSGTGSMGPKLEGQAFDIDAPIMGGTVTIEATPYGMGLEVSQEMYRDEMYGAIMDLLGEMIRAARTRKEIDAHAPINDAFAGASFTGFDGLALCHTAHTRLDAGATQANRPSPDVGFSITAIQAMMLGFHRLVGERGLPEVLSPKMGLIDGQNATAAREILASSGKPYTTDNEVNAILQEDLIYMISHYLNVATHWHFTAGKGIHDVWFYVRDDTETDSFDDPRTRNGVWTIYQRHKPGFGRWRGWYGSTG